MFSQGFKLSLKLDLVQVLLVNTAVLDLVLGPIYPLPFPDISQLFEVWTVAIAAGGLKQDFNSLVNLYVS